MWESSQYSLEIVKEVEFKGGAFVQEVLPGVCISN